MVRAGAAVRYTEHRGQAHLAVSPVVGSNITAAYRGPMTQQDLPEWAVELPISKPRPTAKPVTQGYQPPVRDIEVRDERIGTALIRWAFDGETGAFDSARVYNSSGWQVGHYTSIETAREAATRCASESSST